MNSELYIGLMSGTSMDAIDAVLVAIDDTSCSLKGKIKPPYPDAVRTRLAHLIDSHETISLREVGALHIEVARTFAAVAGDLMKQTGVTPDQVTAVGSHGQTVMHDPDGVAPFSMQLGDPGTLAALIGVPVVADFRAADIALGGQGAPLVPAFHRWAFGHPREIRAVVNIGGIANVTLMPPDADTTGFDTGPGNVLLDQWCRAHLDAALDAGGAWAAGGTVDDHLLKLLRSDAYFARTPPKSTGTDYFNRTWLENILQDSPGTPDPQDVQATLSELTAVTIADALHGAQSVRVCGGGVWNTDLLGRLDRLLPGCSIASTSDWGLDPDWVEAMAFAWLARQRMHGEPGNLPAVTGARAPISLGGVFLPPQA
ncbi:MAG: anhydro-N-acetylmuramic acid kinase [Gammaproteobacteria bacterium]|nr:MAG: anhydro-N-acetylmuramic acid kinase [Gammaproteobacteria bacterium]